MSYTALYRKFRPSGFESVKGQDHIVTTLRNQIKTARVGHAYLFTGTRGTGKTSVAKILAKAVNCENPIDGSPCGQCSMCTKIADKSSLNVIEIDAASNNGVDNIRDIVEEVQYSPTEGKYKVYIIDEVHMLSTGAFNALLKTLEEPPSYVIFILATTEVQKIPVTILSRCQRYDFHRITTDTIAARLQELMEHEGIECEEKALRYVAKMGDGSLRDALSLLDQCLAFHYGKVLKYDDVLDVLGTVDMEAFSNILGSILDCDVGSCLRYLEDMVVAGKELGQFVTDFTWYLRNVLLMKASANGSDLVDASSENILLLQKDADRMPEENIIRYIHILSELSGQMRYASQKRVLLEVALVKLCKPQMDKEQGYTQLINRITNLEKQIESGTFTVTGQTQMPHAAMEGQTSAQDGTKVNEAPKKPKKLPKAIPDDIKKIVADWDIIMARLFPPVAAMLEGVKRTVGEGESLLLIFDDATAEKSFSGDEEHMESLRSTLNSYIGKNVTVQTKLVPAQEKNDLEDLASFIDFEVEIEK